MAAWLLALAAAGAVLGPQAKQADAADPCAAAGACRHIDQYRIEGPDGRIQMYEAGVTLPWVLDGNVLLTPGEAVTVRLDESEDAALVPQLVRSGDAARTAALGENEVRFDFGTFDRGQVMLTVESGYPLALDYAALTVSVSEGPERTSVCTLMPGVPVYELWEAPIYQLALWRFRPADGYGCRIVDPEVGFGEHEG